jgi:hypothetical protein
MRSRYTKHACCLAVLFGVCLATSSGDAQSTGGLPANLPLDSCDVVLLQAAHNTENQKRDSEAASSVATSQLRANGLATCLSKPLTDIGMGGGTRI